MKEFLSITKALSDESRVRALMALGGGELCVCQIIELLGLAPSTVSKHMTILYQAGLVETRKDGRWIYYRLAGEDAPPSVQGAIQWVRRSLQALPDVRDDAKRARTVRRMDKGRLCCHYK
jgi:predicted ArsR family transcriptional regulator